MSVWKRFDSFGHPSLITTNLEDRRPILKRPEVAQLFIKTVADIRDETGCRLHAFVVMPDHVHLVVTANDTRMSRVMQLIKGRFARMCNARAGAKGPIWQSRYHEVTLRSERATCEAMRYVVENPVAAGLSDSPESFPWSSVSSVYSHLIDPL